MTAGEDAMREAARLEAARVYGRTTRDEVTGRGRRVDDPPVSVDSTQQVVEKPADTPNRSGSSGGVVEMNRHRARRSA